MVAKRGQIWWAEMGEPQGPEPGYRRRVPAGRIKSQLLSDVDSGLRLVLGL